MEEATSMEKGQAHHPSSLKERGLKAKPPQIQNHGATEPIMSLGPTVAQKSPKDKGIPLLCMITASEKRWGDTPLHQRLQRNLSWWTKNAPQEVVDIIKEGIKPPWTKPPIMSTLNISRGGDLEKVQEILLDYSKSGAIKIVQDHLSTKHLIPWFLISKKTKEEEKWRLISDCRELNQWFTPQPFKLENMNQIFPNLSKGHWGAKIDLKDAYFHIPIHGDLKPFLRHQVGDQVWEYQGGLFGLNIMPQIFMKVMKVFQKRWRQKGLLVYVYLDDILLIAPTPSILEAHLRVVVQDLVDSGFKLNLKKCFLEASQVVDHLGFQINFQEGKLQLAPQKVKALRKELGKFITKTNMSKRQLAAILGQVRSNLVAMPFLRAFTSLLVGFLKQNASKSWESSHQIPQTLKDQLQDIKLLLQNWQGRPFTQSPTRFLHTDSSTYGWGGWM